MKSLGVHFALQGVTTNVSTLRLQKWPYPRLDVYHRNGLTKGPISATEMAVLRPTEN